MRALKVYFIDAFAENQFEGNPAAVIPLEKWLPDHVMQALAAENNLSETAFFVERNGSYNIRWFTPVDEVKLCGHATLASAYVLFYELGYEQDIVRFESLSGELYVRRAGRNIVLDFPVQAPTRCDAPVALIDGLGENPIDVLASEDYLVIFDNESQVECMKPEFGRLESIPLRGVIVSARSTKFDFVVRFFAPKLGVDEDPVTGSAYTQLAPYWSIVLNKRRFSARQISVRGGNVGCEMSGDRVLISGTAVKYMEGSISLDENNTN